MIFRHERRGIIGGKLFVFLVKRWVLISLAKCLLQNIYAILGRAWRKKKRLAGNPEGALQNDELAIYVRFGKALKLRQMSETGMRALGISRMA